MSQEHFNRSLSQTRTLHVTASVKWAIRVKQQILLKVTETLPNGGGRQHWQGKGEAIIIRRADVEHVHDYARVNRKLRDFLLVRAPMKMGLRTTELATLNIEDIDFGSFRFQVLDSKKKKFYWLPLDGIWGQLTKDLIGNRTEGPVFRREENQKVKMQNKPMSRTAIWYLFHGIGMAAGVKAFNPRICRHYFACKWIEDMKKPGSKKTIVDLQEILRHDSLLTTTFYVARLRWFEDIEAAYHEMQEPHIAGMGAQATSQFYRDFCSHCEREATCKYVDQVAGSPWASGCRFFKPKKEELTRHAH
jgi:integrase